MLAIDTTLIENNTLHPVLQDKHNAIKNIRPIDRNTQSILHIVVTDLGVGIRTDKKTERR